MLPKLALLASFAFSLWLIGRDKRWRQFSSTALWVPAVWLALGSSRGMAFWFAQLGLTGGGQGSRLEGSSVNVVFNNGIFLVAILILISRGFNWIRYALSNKGLFLFYGFFLISAAWSPFPVPTVKRWIQEFGWLLIAPIVLTEPDPAASLRVMFVRVAYILFPLSVILMRYFPDIGRVDSFHGSMMLSGVADHKNSLGQLCFVFCLVAIWDLMETRKADVGSAAKPEFLGRVLNLGIGFYLLYVASSATSWMCFFLGLALLLVSKRLAAMKNARRVFILGALAIVSVIGLQQTFHLTSMVSEAFGRGSDMTGRGEIWETALAKNTDYFFGAGFRGFWETSAGKEVYEELGTGELITAHNGYIETYLNGGVVGLCALAIFICSTGLITTTKLVEKDPMGKMAVVFWPLMLIYNLSESQFMMTGTIWYTMLLVTMVVRHEPSEIAIAPVKKVTWQPRQPSRQFRGTSTALSGRDGTRSFRICQA